MSKGRYERDLNHNYLVFACQEKEDYRVRMLEHHKMQEILPCMVRRMDGKFLFTYDIEDMQSLEQLFETRPMNVEALYGLMSAVCSAVGHMEAHLLEEDMLLLDPAYIFGRKGSKEYRFCCCPGEETPLPEQFRQLCAHLLHVLDQKDAEAVQFGFLLYRSTLEESFSLEKILKELGQKTGSFLKKESGRSAGTENIPAVEQKKPAREDRQPYKETGVRLPVQDAVAFGAVKEQEKGITARPGSQDRIIKPRKNAEYLKKIRRKTRASKVSGMTEEEKKMGSLRERKVQEEIKPISPLPSYAMEEVFAYGKDKKERFLLQSTNREEILFAPASFPFLLGSLPSGVDGFIDDVTVSRFHARIDEKSDGYYVTDLYSENGTFIAGRRLAPEVPQKLCQGDPLRLGSVEFAVLYKNSVK